MLKKTLLLMIGFLLVPPVFARPADHSAMFGLPALNRADFNRLSNQAGNGLFWSEDSENPGVLDPAELLRLGVDEGPNPFVIRDQFTKAFEESYRALVDMRRRESIRLEMDQGMPTLVHTDLTGIPIPEKKMVRAILSASDKIDRLYMRQVGSLDLWNAGSSALDPESRSVFIRNQGPWCVAAKTENDAYCNAMWQYPGRTWTAYPHEMKHDQAMCDRLSKMDNARDLLAPFTVVRKVGDGLKGQSLNTVYGAEMEAIALDLDLASGYADKAGENAFAKYLRAAAKGHRINDWADADEAWSAMNSTNSKYYLRIGPDEVYWDICQTKAGFHSSFARIDTSSLDLQKALDKLRTSMENSLGDLVPEYKPRQVSFSMPDFIAIIVNAGNSRSPIGATIGQSLPNWGKVAEEGRGRTVVMTNLYLDDDSKRIAQAKASLMLTEPTLAYFAENQRVALIDIILHEATHNLGPYSDYKLDGKDPREVFGGALATVLEELKAQTGSWFYVDLLVKEGILTPDEAKQLYTHSLVWSFGHLSQGLWSPNGNPKPYSQLSAVQVGRLVDAGALKWIETVDPETGKAMGKFEMDYDKVSGFAKALMADVVRVKATGDVAGAKALVDPYVSGDKAVNVHVCEIQERLLQFSKGSLVYKVEL